MNSRSGEFISVSNYRRVIFAICFSFEVYREKLAFLSKCLFRILICNVNTHTHRQSNNYHTTIMRLWEVLKCRIAQSSCTINYAKNHIIDSKCNAVYIFQKEQFSIVALFPYSILKHYNFRKILSLINPEPCAPLVPRLYKYVAVGARTRGPWQIIMKSIVPSVLTTNRSRSTVSERGLAILRQESRAGEQLYPRIVGLERET